MNIHNNSVVNLPISKYREEILNTIEKNNVVIISAETGAGKSTQVPKYLVEQGYNVVVTQPRRLAARTVACRVAEEMGCEIGSLVGYRTAFERADSLDTRLLFCTDGLQLVREITSSSTQSKFHILVIDEVHEWNINIEALVAWTKKRIQEGWNIKIVLMSATLETEDLSRYFKDPRTNFVPPIIEVEGRKYPVETEERGPYCLVDSVVESIRQGKNILVFQPGKTEIEETINKINYHCNDFNIEAIVLPLHGQLDPQDQAKCFKKYSFPKVVVATNVAQTSITIPDIDIVVDSGMEKIIKTNDGVEGLYLNHISKADCEQRKGRSGRTKEGTYILCSDIDFEERTEFPIVEIERVRLDQLVLRLGSVGIDATEIEFFHQPEKNRLIEAKKTLFALGAMLEDGTVTKTGKLMSKFPVSVQFAKMILTAQQLGVISDVITVAAILEAGGLRDRTSNWRKYTEEKNSDILAELDLWRAALTRDRTVKLKDMGIIGKSFARAKELRQKLYMSLKGLIKIYSCGDRDKIKKACVAGMVEHLYHKQSWGDYRNGGCDRKLSQDSVIENNPEWIVGNPLDIQFKNRKGRLCTLNLVNMASAVDPEWLVEVAPQIVTSDEVNMFYNESEDACFATRRIFFNKQIVKEENVATQDRKEGNRLFCEWLARQIQGNNCDYTGELREFLDQARKTQKKALELNIRSGSKKFNIDWQEWLISLTDDATSRKEVSSWSKLIFPDLDKTEVGKVIQENPTSVVFDGVEIPISYGVDYCGQCYAKATIEKEFVYNKRENNQIKLPGGRVVSLDCCGLSAYSFEELLLALEKDRVQKCWQEKKAQYNLVVPLENLQSICSNMTDVVQITSDYNNNPVLGYKGVSMKSSDHGTVVEVELYPTEELAHSKNRDFFETLLYINFKEIEIPSEMPWEKSSNTFYSARQMTQKGKKLEEKMQNIINVILANINFDNYESLIQKGKTELNQAIEESGFEYKKIQNTLNYIEENFKKFNSLPLYPAIQEGNDLIKLIKVSLLEDEEEKAKNLIAQLQNLEKEIHEFQNRIEKGEILFNFEAWHRRRGMSNNGDGWVIKPDGTLRQHDNQLPRYEVDGYYKWSYVDSDEIALEWSCKTLRDLDSSSSFTVVKRPQVVSPQQEERVRQIEEEIGAQKNSFEVEEKPSSRIDKSSSTSSPTAEDIQALREAWGCR
jgi:HrpA-like RNA helicase